MHSVASKPGCGFPSRALEPAAAPPTGLGTNPTAGTGLPATQAGHRPASSARQQRSNLQPTQITVRLPSDPVRRGRTKQRQGGLRPPAGTQHSAARSNVAHADAAAAAAAKGGRGAGCVPHGASPAAPPPLQLLKRMGGSVTAGPQKRAPRRGDRLCGRVDRHYAAARRRRHSSAGNAPTPPLLCPVPSVKDSPGLQDMVL